MIRTHRFSGPILALVLLGAAPHITPTVVLKKQADAIKEAVPDARHFFVRTVDIGKADFDRIKDEGDFEPEDDEMDFYYGTDAAGANAGVVLFPQVNTQHGPLEVGLTMNPDGTIRRVVVTKATVETKPWVLRAVEAGLTDGFRGMRPGDDPTAALNDLSRADLGQMPYYMAGVAAKAVRAGLALYDVLYAEGPVSGDR